MAIAFSRLIILIYPEFAGVVEMEVGLVGLGKMGLPLALNMLGSGQRVTVYSRSPEKAKAAEAKGLAGTSDLELFTRFFSGRKVIWLMVPAGDPVDQMIVRLNPLLAEGDLLIDGGNSHYRDSIRRAETLKNSGIEYADIGISGGPDGARSGACMMVGSTEETYAFLFPLLKELCVENGCLHSGPTGAGHYIKMIHNGIEYGMLQAIAEGFELMDAGPFDLDYRAIAELWNSGSVIRGWLIELTAQLFAGDPHLEKLRGVIGSSGTGLWTVEEGLSRQVPTPVIAQSLFARYRSEQQDPFSARLVAGLRREFGGHDIEEA
jgi:6-phosphogluconate dehydrogenase